ncbi:MAG: hypothetical protein ABIA77_02200 [Candidatus Omnitrophota bacterium]
MDIRTVRRITEERRWRKYYKFEKRKKAQFLRKMSANDGFRILKELYQFAARLRDKTRPERFDRDKVRMLTDVHLLFNRVKP